MGRGLDEAVADARQATADAIDANMRAGRQSRAVAYKLRAHGLSTGDIAMVLGVSRQRVCQLLPAAREKE